jgi:hypothetical protein
MGSMSIASLCGLRCHDVELNRRSHHCAALWSKNITRGLHPHRDLSTALRFGRDDKGQGGASGNGSCRTEAVFHHLGRAEGP